MRDPVPMSISKKVLTLMKATKMVCFKEAHNGNLYYDCMAILGPVEFAETIFTFPIPFEDTAGAVFKAVDQKPMHFMRWIRKEVERQAEEQRMIAAEKAKWEEELRSRG